MENGTFVRITQKPDVVSLIKKEEISAVIAKQTDDGEYAVFVWLIGREKPLHVGTYETWRKAEKKISFLERELNNE